MYTLKIIKKQKLRSQLFYLYLQPLHLKSINKIKKIKSNILLRLYFFSFAFVQANPSDYK